MVTVADFRSLPDCQLHQVGTIVFRSFLLGGAQHRAMFRLGKDGWVLVEAWRV